MLERALHDLAVPVVLLDGTDPHLPVVWVNRAFEVTTGYDADDARRHQRDPVPPGARKPDALLAVRDAVREHREVSQTLSLRRADGSVYTCRVQLSPLVDADEVVTHWVVALQDLTDQISHDAQQASLVEAERRERRVLGIVTQVSDLLMDVDDRMTPLHEIASLLRHAL
ncbi:MAG TPA: PAS domain-containing protein, partial [Cellulomonas sp.]|nr:PAS domain-containing protein [Cellulomonas sp.]